MQTTLIELNPNRQLLDSNFDGYKLSLTEIPKKKRDLAIAVDRVLLDTNQYSLLHANLYGFHNHLTADPYDETSSVYFVDKELSICKVYVDPFNEELIDPIKLLTLPRKRERISGDYNVSLRFASPTIAVISDGIENLYIVNTGSRNDDDAFNICFSDEVTDSGQSFVVVDAIVMTNKDSNEELHVLALSLKRETEQERYFSLLHWITFTKVQDVWGQTAIKQVKSKGCVQYAFIEKNCEAIYVASDDECKFTLNSDFPIIEETSRNINADKKVYTWSQNINEITIRIKLSGEIVPEQVKINQQFNSIEVKANNAVLISGDLYHRIDTNMTTWKITQDSEPTLEIILGKEETGLMWPEFIKNDLTGEFVLNSCIQDETQAKFAHLTSETEDNPQSGTTFNSQQVEECDFENDKACVFQRLCGQTNNTTHKVNLGSHQILVTAQLNQNDVPAMGIRHDVDICLWQPQKTNENFSITHEGTLLALGYVQASKQNKKFTVCPPDMSYAVICETSGHLFIYRQNKKISSTELRNRSTGRRIQSIAQQQVVNLSNDEILGIYGSNKSLFLLCEKSVTVLTL
ncbi:nudC domain-containing protein 1 [Diabrotica undecimpunctata]|uniref:nudC domain-containing protein 1 n=1 Tax=Diabrotica undecimpunctata TaxID=50387 RepID=UPI003B637C17